MPTSSAEADAPRVVAIHPACAVWPANILRIHVIFDRPMDRDRALDHVRIETATGERVHGALVDMPDGLWTPDQCVLTVLLHPGRVKQVLGEHLRQGRALELGRDYAFRVDRALTDAQGRPLGCSSVAPFHAGAPVDTAIDPARWRLSEVPVGTTDPVSIGTDRPLDALGAQVGLRLRTAGGATVPATFEPAGLTVVARPLAPWCERSLVVEAASDLEDACGNRPTNPFELQLPAALAPDGEDR